MYFYTVKARKVEPTKLRTCRLFFRILYPLDKNQNINSSDTKGFGTTSDTQGGGGVGPIPLLSRNSLDVGTWNFCEV